MGVDSSHHVKNLNLMKEWCSQVLGAQHNLAGRVRTSVILRKGQRSSKDLKASFYKQCRMTVDIFHCNPLRQFRYMLMVGSTKAGQSLYESPSFHDSSNFSSIHHHPHLHLQPGFPEQRLPPSRLYSAVRPFLAYCLIRPDFSSFSSYK